MNRDLPKASGSIQEDQLAGIFLKPGVWRHRRSIMAARIVLRPLSWFSTSRSALKIEDLKRILIFDPGALGDMALLIPCLQRLRATLPHTKLTLLGRPGAGSFLLEQKLVDEWVPVEIPWAGSLPRWRANFPLSLSWRNLLRTVLGLRSRRFDLAFAAGWSCDLRANLILWLSGALCRAGYGYAGGEFFLTSVVRPDLTRPHVVDRTLQLLQEIGVFSPNSNRAIDISQEDRQCAEELLAKRSISEEDLIIGIHAGAGSAIREWGDERFAEVGRWATDRFGAKILWFSDPGKPKPSPINLHDAVSLALPLRQFMAMVSRCQLFICNDSGPMHVAAALRVPVVAVFGAQRPEWFGPYGDGHRVVIRHDVWCRPCADKCIWEEPYCLRLITVEEVMRAVEEAMKDAAPASSHRLRVLA